MTQLLATDDLLLRATLLSFRSIVKCAVPYELLKHDSASFLANAVTRHVHKWGAFVRRGWLLLLINPTLTLL